MKKSPPYKYIKKTKYKYKKKSYRKNNKAKRTKKQYGGKPPKTTTRKQLYPPSIRKPQNKSPRKAAINEAKRRVDNKLAESLTKTASGVYGPYYKSGINKNTGYNPNAKKSRLERLGLYPTQKPSLPSFEIKQPNKSTKQQLPTREETFNGFN